ncbi:MAG: hypothetical protein EBU21_17345, partial [Proteobacteria bacterium]|nr:hypothetical protein [Pseudomonadota bacterium]
FQIGANSGNTLGVTLSGVRSEDLGDVKTLNSINSAITGGAKTIDVGNRTGVNYNASVDTAFDLRDAINSAGGNITASIKNGKLRLESSAAVGTVFANDGGALASTLFATNATVNTVDATTSLEDLGVSASGTMTITATSAAITGATLLANLGISSGDTLVLGLSKTAGTGGAAGTMTLADIGVTAGGSLGFSLTNGGPVSFTYATTDTLTSFASNMQAALQAIGNGSDNSTVTYTQSTGLAITVSGSGSNDTLVASAFTAGTGVVAALGLSTTPTAASAYQGSQVNTAAFTESVTYTVGSEADLTAFAAGLQTAIQGAGAIGTSTAALARPVSGLANSLAA